MEPEQVSLGQLYEKGVIHSDSEQRCYIGALASEAWWKEQLWLFVDRDQKQKDFHTRSKRRPNI